MISIDFEKLFQEIEAQQDGWILTGDIPAPTDIYLNEEPVRDVLAVNRVEGRLIKLQRDALQRVFIVNDELATHELAGNIRLEISAAHFN